MMTKFTVFKLVIVHFRMQSFGLEHVAEKRRSGLRKHWDALTNFLEENRQHIFFLFVFYVITIALFVDRFICKCAIFP